MPPLSTYMCCGLLEEGKNGTYRDWSGVQIISSHHKFQCHFRFNVEFSLLPTAILRLNDKTLFTKRD
ncbi:hypothetical protein HanRHA438_Chr11g0504961 [Helianthus annuus]|nr:hypothetical protein HanRHA438_Chr11g0504961 [Helianthus annuus]